MRKIRDVLRLSAEGLSTRQIASSLAIGRTTLRGYLERADELGLRWPLPPSLSDTDLERLIYPRTARDVSNRATQPDWAHVHRELRRKGVTLREFEHAIVHLMTAAELCYRVHLHLHVEIGHGTAPPNDPGKRDVMRPAVKNHFLDEAAQQCLALSIRDSWIVPYPRKPAGKGDDLAVKSLAHRTLGALSRRRLFGECRLGCPDLHQRGFPATFQFCGNKAVTQPADKSLINRRLKAVPSPRCQTTSFTPREGAGRGRAIFCLDYGHKSVKPHLRASNYEPKPQ